MSTGLRAAWGAGVLVLGLALLASAQPPGAAHPGTQLLISSGGLNSPSAGGPAGGQRGQLVREIDDLHTGDRWLLMRNGEVPGGPGRLVLVAAGREALSGAPERVARQPEAARPLPVIRAGERLTVEEHTARVDALLEARALNSAAAGSAFNARLALGGRVVRVVALGPGRAALQPETEARR